MVSQGAAEELRDGDDESWGRGVAWGSENRKPRFPATDNDSDALETSS